MLSVMREQMHCCVVSIDVVVVSVVRLLMSGDLARLADTMPNLDELCLHLAWRRNLLKISAQVSEDEDGPPEEVLRLKISLVQASLNRIIALCRSPPASAPSKHKTKMQMRRPASTTASCRSCLDSGVNADSFSAQMLNEAVEAHARAPKEDSSVSLPDLCVCVGRSRSGQDAGATARKAQRKKKRGSLPVLIFNYGIPETAVPMRACDQR